MKQAPPDDPARLLAIEERDVLLRAAAEKGMEDFVRRYGMPDSPEAYDAFLEQAGADNPARPLATERRDALRYEVYKRKGTSEALIEFVTKYPDNPMAKRLKDEQASQQAVHENRNLRSISGIIVTAGPLNGPYEPLGPVHVDTIGVVNFGSVMTDSLFRSRLGAAVQQTPKARADEMNEALKARAVALYGNRVDAVINVTSQTHPDGNVFADGLAVHFIQAQQPPAQAVPARRSTQERLEELRSLLDRGSISRKEYDRKREEILKEL